jgi:hypothetical protein
LAFLLVDVAFAAKEKEIKEMERANSHLPMVPLRGCAEPHIVWKTPLLKNAKRSVSFSVSESPNSRTLLEMHMQRRASCLSWPDLATAAASASAPRYTPRLWPPLELFQLFIFICRHTLTNN